MPESRVKLTDQERLDAPDARALQELVYQYQREALGDLLGGGVGTLSPIVWTLADGGIIALLGSMSPFALVTQQRDLTRSQPSTPAVTVAHAWKTQIISFDPAAAGHVNYPVDLLPARTAAAAAGYTTRPIVWARPFQLDTDTDTRRVWDVGTAVEVATPLETRTHTRLEFAVSETAPAVGVGADWAPIAYCSGWSLVGSYYQPFFQSVSVWDSEDLFDWTGESGDVFNKFTNKISAGWLEDRIALGSDAFDSAHGLSAGYAPGADRGAGLVTMLHFIRRGLQRILSGGSADGAGTSSKSWLGIPSLSLEGLRVSQEAQDARLDGLDADVAESREIIDRRSEAAIVLASGVFQYVPAGAYSGVAEGWYVIQGSGFYETVKTGATWAEFTAKFAPPAAEITAINSYYVTSILTAMDSADLFGSPSGSEAQSLVLSGLIQPRPGNPVTYSPSRIITAYKGATVGLSSSEYGIPFALYGSRVGALQMALIDPSTLTAGGSAPMPTFHVTVYASKYLPGEAIL